MIGIKWNKRDFCPKTQLFIWKCYNVRILVYTTRSTNNESILMHSSPFKTAHISGWIILKQKKNANFHFKRNIKKGILSFTMEQKTFCWRKKNARKTLVEIAKVFSLVMSIVIEFYAFYGSLKIHHFNCSCCAFDLVSYFFCAWNRHKVSYCV